MSDGDSACLVCVEYPRRTADAEPMLARLPQPAAVVVVLLGDGGRQGVCRYKGRRKVFNVSTKGKGWVL